MVNHSKNQSHFQMKSPIDEGGTDLFLINKKPYNKIIKIKKNTIKCAAL